jgi:hypothetical protein
MCWHALCKELVITPRQEHTMATTFKHQEAHAHAFELRYDSLFQAGRAYTFPCDARGHVDMDSLGDRVRVNYLFVRALVGREYAMPEVCVSIDACSEASACNAMPPRELMLAT